jgi:hypothetical protein
MTCRYFTCRTQERRTIRRGRTAMMSSFVLWFGLWSVLAMAPHSEDRAEAAVTASTRYDLEVLPRLTGLLRIVGPGNSALLTHDGTDADQRFGQQQWAIRNNFHRGATVTFETRTAFRNTTAAGTIKRDARIQMGIARQEAGANWAVTTATDQTRYASGDEFAIVTATSTVRGDAVFDIFVTFVTSDFGTLRAGTYSTTVIGTITAN